jgi:RimJ/RimL family protein N-acetyltransferase
MFGRIIDIQNSKIGALRLQPIKRTDVPTFIPWYQMHSVGRYLNQRDYNARGYTEEEEFEWYNSVVKDKNSIVWGIYSKDKLIGTISLMNIDTEIIRECEIGISIFNKEY